MRWIQVKSDNEQLVRQIKLDMETSLNVRNEEMIRNIRKLLQVNKFKERCREIKRNNDR